MKVLIVAPVEEGSGETITALHMAEKLQACGDEVRFLASPFAAGFVEKHFPDGVRRFGKDPVLNRLLWEKEVRGMRPDVVLFADYPLMFLTAGTSPLADRNGWVAEVEALDAAVVTLDHTGFAQKAGGYFFGPPHLSLHWEEIPATPGRMHLLLPCPMHEPGPVTGRRGQPFRYWDVPLSVPEEGRRDLRRRYLEREDDPLIFHSVPNWAWQHADLYNLPLYDFLPEILDLYLRDLPRPATVVSVNNGSLLLPHPEARTRFVNLSVLPKADYEALLFGADLMLTENSISISMGKAVCGLQPCATLKNSFRLLQLLDRLDGNRELRDLLMTMERIRLGSVFPFEIFPSGAADLLEKVILYKESSLPRAFRALEIFGGEETGEALRRLLTEPAERAALRARQQEYVDKVRELPDAPEVLRQLVAEDRRGGG